MHCVGLLITWVCDNVPTFVSFPSQQVVVRLSRVAFFPPPDAAAVRMTN